MASRVSVCPGPWRLALAPQPSSVYTRAAGKHNETKCTKRKQKRTANRTICRTIQKCSADPETDTKKEKKRNEKGKETETERNGKRFFDSYCITVVLMCCNKKNYDHCHYT